MRRIPVSLDKDQQYSCSSYQMGGKLYMFSAARSRCFIQDMIAGIEYSGHKKAGPSNAGPAFSIVFTYSTTKLLVTACPAAF